MRTCTREELITQYEARGDPVPAMVRDAPPETEFVYGFSGLHGGTIPLMLSEDYENNVRPPKVLGGISLDPILPD